MSDSTVVMELLALSGYGHIVIDHEHSITDVHRTQSLLQALESSWQSLSRTSNDESSSYSRRTEPIVRLPGPNDTVYMKKVLDTLRLPAGVLVPMVEDVASARAVVAATRYPYSTGTGSSGLRGCAIPFIRATSYGNIDRETYLEQCQNDLLVMVQVESPQAIESIPDIAQIDGIDAIFLGPLDLSSSIGKMGQFDDPQFTKLMQQAEQSIISNGCLLAGFRPPNQTIQSMFEKGYSLICGSVDLGLLKDAARVDAKKGNDAIQKSMT
jgi:2-keto-3-deoxy-L-rhamnonate aldolase RhmA